ncbi:amino acid permease [Arcanobacterium haemolyticum]|nr:amino acid permease [Arcanobacterium haemolyticum]
MGTPLSRQLVRRRMPSGLVDSGIPDDIIQVDDAQGTHLERTMSTLQLTLIGIGVTVGTGIFFIFSEVVPEAGPAVIISFLMAAVVAGLTVVCYAELASAIPSSGSSYSFTYATMGEFTAFLVGACLILEYGVSAAAVSVGWSEYLNLLLENLFHFRFPQALSAAPDAGGIINLPAIILVAMCMALLLRGTTQSARVNAVMVAIKLAVLLSFAAVAFTGFQADHFANFAPFGMKGITTAGGMLVFSFLGLDAMATAGAEVKNPTKALPRALIAALTVVTGLYLIVAVAAIGAQPLEGFQGQSASLASIVQNVVGASWPGTVLAIGAVISIFSVTLICIYSNTRVVYSMSHDGLLPSVFSRLSANHVPAAGTLIVAAVVALLSGLLPIGILAGLTSIGALSAFALVSVGVIILRRTAPDMKRGFKVPGYPVTPILSIAACIYMISGLHTMTLKAFAVWMTLVVIFYFTWARRHSQLEKLAATGDFSNSVA